MSIEGEQQEEKNIEQPNIIEPERIESTIKESKYKKEYSQIMNFKRKCFTQNQLIEKLMNNQIKTHRTPSQKQLDIISINTSTNYEIIDLQVKVGLYSMKIHIINNQGQSPIHNESWIAEGTFGKVYKYTSQSGQKRAVKCIQIKKNVRFEQQIFKVIHQYALLKIASAVEIGPSVASQNFDIICYRNSKHPLKKISLDSEQSKCCIQFEMELCEPTKIINPQQIEPLYQNLYNLHLLGCSHNDIKPDNILFSPTFNKWVYLDYGVSSCNKQKIGQSSYTFFRGTLQYSTPEMSKLLTKGAGFVDLYWNDIHGLQLSIKVLKKPRKQPIMVKIQKDENVDINTRYLLLKLKYYLYYYNFPAIQNICLKIKWGILQKKCIFYFMLQLQFIPQELKNFLGNLIKDWSDIQTMQYINPKQIFGIVTSSLTFRNQKVSKIKDLQQKFTTFKQMSSILIDEFYSGNSDNNINKAIFKKQHKERVKILQNQKQARQMQENSYILMLFEFVDFIKSKMTISLKKKSAICKIFQKIKTQNKEITQRQLQNEPINDQMNEFSLQSIRFFINYLINIFIQKPDQLLQDLFPRLYLNYLILGIAQTSTIKSIYQSINNIKWPLKKQIQYFSLIYKNKFWYENVVYMKEIIDIFDIRKTQLKILKNFYKIISFNQQEKNQDQHTCSQEDMCYDLERTMFKAVSEYNEKNNNINSFDKRLNNYSSILQKLYKNLMHINLDHSEFQLAESIVLQIQSNKTLVAKLGKIRFSQSQIPLNLCQLYTAQLFGLNSQSFCEAAQHIQQIINHQQITQFWFIIILKNLIKFQQQKDKSKITKYFFSIKQIYSTLSKKNLSVLYMICFHRVRFYFLKQFVKVVTNPQLIWLIINKLQFLNKLIGDKFTAEQLAEFLISLNEANAMAVWGYIRLIKKDQHRVAKILKVLLSKISLLCCKTKSQVKLLSFTIFSNIYQNKKTCITNEQIRNLNKFVFAQNGPQQIQFLKLRFIEYWITKLLRQKKYNERKLQLSQYFDELNKIMKIQEYQPYFLTQKIRYHVFCLYFIYLLKKKQFQKAFELVQILCKRIFSYISIQTYFLLFRFKAYLFNYYLTEIKCFILQWPSFRNYFVNLSRKKKHSALQLLNICCVYIDLNYQSCYKQNYYLTVDRISYRDMLIMNYKALKILDLMNLSYKWHQIDCYYRCWMIFLDTQFMYKQHQFVKTRFLIFLSKQHKRVIQIQLKNSLKIKQDQLYYYADRRKIEIKAHFNKARLKQNGQDTLIYLEKFKQKLNEYYSQQKSIGNTYVRFTK